MIGVFHSLLLIEKFRHLLIRQEGSPAVISGCTEYRHNLLDTVDVNVLANQLHASLAHQCSLMRLFCFCS